jgi:hypothetical protein
MRFVVLTNLLLGSRATRAAPLEQQNATVVIPAGFKSTLFSDDFSTYKAGALSSASGKWTFDTGTSYPGGPENWGTGEVQTYTSAASNIAITSDGVLEIVPQLSGGKWTSARIETTAANDFQCGPGKRLRIEANIWLASGANQMGIWPAFWSLGSAFRQNYSSWPGIGELDILESVNGAAKVWHTLHCGTNPGGVCHETTGIGNSSALSRDAWHTLAVEIDRTNTNGWQGEKLQWFVDGKSTFTVVGSSVGDQNAWINAVQTKKFLLLNVAVGGALPNAINNNQNTPTAKTTGGASSAMRVKHVAVFST